VHIYSALISATRMPLSSQFLFVRFLKHHALATTRVLPSPEWELVMNIQRNRKRVAIVDSIPNVKIHSFELALFNFAKVGKIIFLPLKQIFTLWN
jgi:hypothetical protein